MRFDDYDIRPLKSWKKFQKMVCDLFKKIWDDPFAQEFGREGQNQDGIDILGTRRKTKTLEAVQATTESPITERKIKKDYDASQNLDLELDCFIVATTSKRDAKIQKYAASLSKNGPYRCIVLFWEEILDYLSDHDSLRKKYYPTWVFFKGVGDSTGKLLEINDDTSRWVLLITKLREDYPHYGGLLLICDLLNHVCQTYRLGDHWSRLILEGIADAGFQRCVGGNKYGAYLLSEWLNSLESVDEVLSSKNIRFAFELTPAKKNEFYEMMRELTEESDE